MSKYEGVASYQKTEIMYYAGQLSVLKWKLGEGRGGPLFLDHVPLKQNLQWKSIEQV